MAYDIDHNGFIDEQEMFQLLKTSAKSKGILTNDLDLVSAVKKVFPTVDKNNDGMLSYTEFKEAIFQNQLLISSFWTDPNFLSTFSKTQMSLFDNNNKNFNMGKPFFKNPNNYSKNHKTHSLFSS